MQISNQTCFLLNIVSNAQISKLMTHPPIVYTAKLILLNPFCFFLQCIYVYELYVNSGAETKEEKKERKKKRGDKEAGFIRVV